MERSVVLISLCLLAGCSTQSQEVDIEKTAQSMISNYYDEASMIKADEDQSRSILMIDMEKNTCTLYVSSSNETNELALCKGEDDAIKEAYEERRDYNISSAKNYFPEEVDKIENTKIEKVGDTWVLITNDKSDEILDAIKATIK